MNKTDFKNALIKFAETTDSIDRYGQWRVMSPNEIFGADYEKYIEFGKEHKLLRVTTYGGSYGTTYLGISPVYDILCSELRKEMDETLRQKNKRYKYVMTIY